MAVSASRSVHRVRQFARLAAGEKVIFSCAFALLGVARLMLWAQPFRRLARCLGQSRRHVGYSHLLDPDQLRQAAQIGKLVRLAARHSPWQSKCLVQAMAAKVLLACMRIPATVYLGVAGSKPRGLQAHAWVTAGPVYVTGIHETRDFTVIAVFTSRAPLFSRARRVRREGLPR